MNLNLTLRFFTLFRILVQPHRLAWILYFRVHQSPQCFNWFRCTVQLTNTGNLYSAPVLQVRLVRFATRSRFCNRFHWSPLRLPVPPHRCFRPCNLLFRCHNPHLPSYSGALCWSCYRPYYRSTFTSQCLGSYSTDW